MVIHVMDSVRLKSHYGDDIKYLHLMYTYPESPLLNKQQGRLCLPSCYFVYASVLPNTCRGSGARRSFSTAPVNWAAPRQVKDEGRRCRCVASCRRVAQASLIPALDSIHDSGSSSRQYLLTIPLEREDLTSSGSRYNT